MIFLHTYLPYLCNQQIRRSFVVARTSATILRRHKNGQDRRRRGLLRPLILPRTVPSLLAVVALAIVLVPHPAEQNDDS
jgi:hypothetical protein